MGGKPQHQDEAGDHQDGPEHHGHRHVIHAVVILVHAVEHWARESGAAGVRVNSNENMNSALSFYKSMGYEYIKTQYNFRKMLK